MSTTSRRAPWTWTEAGVVLDRESEDSLEQVWVAPQLPPESERRWHRLGVEVFCWCADRGRLNDTLAALWRAFGGDSVLVAMRRQDDSVRVLLYTTAQEEMVHRRYLAVRGELRPTAMGLRLVHEPTWGSLGELLASVSSKPEATGAVPTGSGAA
ncbi:MAG: hypothetical protein ACRELB_26795 [Polyangiaceae bacterium]